MAEQIVFEDPPPAARPGRQSKWAPRLEGLMTHPDKWAKWESKSSSAAAKTAKEFGGRWEFAQRTIDGKAWTFVRYLGAGTLIACKAKGCGRRFATQTRLDRHIQADHG